MAELLDALSDSAVGTVTVDLSAFRTVLLDVVQQVAELRDEMASMSAVSGTEGAMEALREEVLSAIETERTRLSWLKADISTNTQRALAHYEEYDQRMEVMDQLRSTISLMASCETKWQREWQRRIERLETMMYNGGSPASSSEKSGSTSSLFSVESYSTPFCLPRRRSVTGEGALPPQRRPENVPPLPLDEMRIPSESSIESDTRTPRERAQAAGERNAGVGQLYQGSGIQGGPLQVPADLRQDSHGSLASIGSLPAYGSGTHLVLADEARIHEQVQRIVHTELERHNSDMEELQRRHSKDLADALEQQRKQLTEIHDKELKEIKHSHEVNLQSVETNLETVKKEIVEHETRLRQFIQDQVSQHRHESRSSISSEGLPPLVSSEGSPARRQAQPFTAQPLGSPDRNPLDGHDDSGDPLVPGTNTADRFANVSGQVRETVDHTAVRMALEQSSPSRGESAFRRVPSRQSSGSSLGSLPKALISPGVTSSTSLDSSQFRLAKSNSRSSSHSSVELRDSDDLAVSGSSLKNSRTSSDTRLPDVRRVSPGPGRVHHVRRSSTSSQGSGGSSSDLPHLDNSPSRSHRGVGLPPVQRRNSRSGSRGSEPKSPRNPPDGGE